MAVRVRPALSVLSSVMLRRPPRPTLFPSRRSSDLIKIMASGGTLTPGTYQHLAQFTPEVLRAAVDEAHRQGLQVTAHAQDRKSTRLNSSHMSTSYAVFCLKKINSSARKSSSSPCIT